jgi:7-carboxy-7-deazaguanine synthase
MKLEVCEIFHSLQGEGRNAGFPSLFIRLARCNLRCKYCDTQYAYQAGEMCDIDTLVHKVRSYRGLHHVTLTGGEPLLQETLHPFLAKLIALRYLVQLETNGSLPIASVPESVIRMVDVKTPSSGEADSFLLKNLDHLTVHDELKFVISDMIDFEFAKDFIKKHELEQGFCINFSPAQDCLPYPTLANLILEHKLKVRLNLQLHKIIWPRGEPKA